MSVGRTTRQRGNGLAVRLGRSRIGPGLTGRGVVLAIIASLAAMAFGTVGIASARAESVSIASPRNGSMIKTATPTFSGFTGDEGTELVTVEVFAGATVTRGAEPVEVLPPEISESGLLGTWSAAVNVPLPDGTYTAQASEPLALMNSAPVTFTIDTTPPAVAITTPANGSSTTSQLQTVAGSAGVAPGDISSVTVQLFAGGTAGPQAPLEALVLPVINGGWTGGPLSLSPGIYTARAEQSDEAGNLGTSAPVTFTVATPPPPPATPPPAASFTWFPTTPKTGENVSLVSSSIDMSSPITAFAWGLTGTAAFQTGKPVVTTSFSTPGSHVVRLRVTAANGLSSIAAETIKVSSAPLSLMQPFPIVRIAGSETFSGVDLRLLSAQAPAGSRITITCKGHACPAKSESRVAVSSKKKTGAVTVEFRRFERALQAGVVLEIRIFKTGQIGKFTRFTVRHDKLPERDDSCLGPTGAKPIVCPSS
jgi:hypothetical protein